MTYLNKILKVYFNDPEVVITEIRPIDSRFLYSSFFLPHSLKYNHNCQENGTNNIRIVVKYLYDIFILKGDFFSNCFNRI